MPLLSNSLSPFAFLTGIPFPGVSISIGDAAFLFILLTILSSFKVNPKFKVGNHVSNEANLFSFYLTKKIFKIIGVLLLLKIVLLYFQSEETAFKYPKKSKTVLPANPKGWVKYAATTFKDKDITNLNKEDKKLLNQIKCRYYSGQNSKLMKDSDYFYLNTALLEQKLSPSFKFIRTKKMISSAVWNQQFDTVYQSHKFVNNKKVLYTNSKYFDAIDLTQKSLNKDLTALINRQIEAFVGQHKNLEVKVLVSNNKTGKLVVDSNYPLSNTHKNPSFYPASSKKIVLTYHYANKQEPVILYDNNKTITPEKWIATSNNAASIYYFSTIKDLDKFESFLHENFNLPYTSNSYQNGYNTDYSRAPEIVVLGGKIKYTSYQIDDWIRACAKNAFLDNNNKLRVLLNSPLLNKYGRGTALKTGETLKKQGFKPHNFICKTGTQESTNGLNNLGSSFVIANKNYSFTVLINGYKKGKHAKDLFNQLVPVLKPCLIEKTE
jgi:hypothetical protein